MSAVEFNHCGEWLSHRTPDGTGWRHTTSEECPVCRGEIAGVVA